jgi:hypothetical protein
MKKIVGLFALVLATSITSHACQQFEAQFIGKVIKIEKVTETTCSVKIDFSSFNSSIVCPLDISEVNGKEIITTECGKKANDTISGILIDDGQKISIE